MLNQALTCNCTIAIGPCKIIYCCIDIKRMVYKQDLSALVGLMPTLRQISFNDHHLFVSLSNHQLSRHQLNVFQHNSRSVFLYHNYSIAAGLDPSIQHTSALLWLVYGCLWVEQIMGQPRAYDHVKVQLVSIERTQGEGTVGNCADPELLDSTWIPSICICLRNI